MTSNSAAVGSEVIESERVAALGVRPPRNPAASPASIECIELATYAAILKFADKMGGSKNHW